MAKKIEETKPEEIQEVKEEIKEELYGWQEAQFILKLKEFEGIRLKYYAHVRNICEGKTLKEWKEIIANL